MGMGMSNMGIRGKAVIILVWVVFLWDWAIVGNLVIWVVWVMGHEIIIIWSQNIIGFFDDFSF